MKKLLRGVKANANLHKKPPIYLLKKLLGMEDHVSKQVQEEEHLVNLYMDLTNIFFFIYLPIFIKTSHLSLLLLSLTCVLDYQDGSHLLSQPWYDMSIDKTWNIKWQTSNLLYRRDFTTENTIYENQTFRATTQLLVFSIRLERVHTKGFKLRGHQVCNHSKTPCAFQ